jgi:hypothetical protein
MLNNFKRWLVLRWLYTIDPNDLLTIAKDRQLNEAFDKWYQSMADQMLNLYFKEYK